MVLLLLHIACIEVVPRASLKKNSDSEFFSRVATIGTLSCKMSVCDDTIMISCHVLGKDVRFGERECDTWRQMSRGFGECMLNVHNITRVTKMSRKMTAEEEN